MAQPLINTYYIATFVSGAQNMNRKTVWR